MACTTIHLTRHDEVHNLGGIPYGRLPGYRLSTLGHQMAQQIADALSAFGYDITRVVISPLERARETGALTAAAFGPAPTTDPRLIGAGNSSEGAVVNRNRWILVHPTYQSSYVNPLRPFWDEPYREIVECMRGAIVSALDLAEGHGAPLVSHQLLAWLLRLFLEGRPLVHDPCRRQCTLASLISLTFEGRIPVRLAYQEPVGDLLRQVRDTVPGAFSAQTADSVSPVSSGSSASPVSPAEYVETVR